MQAFLFIDLSEGAAFEKPILSWVRRQFAGIAMLDVDTASDEMLQHYAVRLLQENPDAVVCIQSGGGELNRLMPLLEELLQPQPLRHILLLGEHPRLQRMFQARPGIRYSVAADEAELQQYLTALP